MEFEIKNSVLERCIPEQNETSVTVPDGVTQIGTNAFEECISLQEITLPDSVTEIGTRAFYHCKALRKINIPHGTVVIGENVFAGCESLEEIELPESLERIGSFAFASCRKLKKVHFPVDLEHIPDTTFLLCPRLTELSFAAVPRQGNALHKWLCGFLSKHRDIPLNMQRLQALDAVSATAFLHAAQTLEDAEITDLMLQYLNENGGITL